MAFLGTASTRCNRLGTWYGGSSLLECSFRLSSVSCRHDYRQCLPASGTGWELSQAILQLLQIMQVALALFFDAQVCPYQSITLDTS